MKDRIIEMLERGERVELECVDKQAYIAETGTHNRLMLRESGLIVSRVNSYGAVVTDDDWLILNKELKYFKIKEPTFNDLIEVAKKAVQDDILSSFTVNDMDYSDLIGRAIYIGLGMRAHRIANEIKRIQSLYTETFVIESEGDILKINDGATVELSNGNSGSVLHVDKHYKTIQFAKEEKHWGALGIFILKGATVTQKRGEV